MTKKRETIEKVIFGILFGIITLFAFLTMSYDDGIVNSEIGLGVCRSIFGGYFGEVYNGLSLSYGLSIYAIYTIWSIPVVLLDMITGKETYIYFDRSTFLWYKSLLVVFFIWACYLFYKIVMEMTADEKESRLFTLLLATASLMVFPVLSITQCDVISLAFSLAGIYNLMRKNDRGFILFFAIAVTMKYLPLFIFIPLFLYRYKRGKQMLIVGAAGASVLLVSLLLISLSDMARYSAAHPSFFDTTAQIRGFFEGSSLWLGIGNMSMVSAYFLSICVFSYFVNAQEEQKYKQWILWITLASWYTLFIFFGANTYWYVLIAPFILLIILNRPEYAGFGMFAQIVLMNVMLLERVCAQGWVFGGGKTFSRLMLRDYVSSHSDLLNNLLNRVTFDLFSAMRSLYISVIVVLSFSLLIRFIPKENSKGKIDYKLLKVTIGIQLAILYVWCGLILAEEIRLTKGIGIEPMALHYSDNVVIKDEGVIISPDAIQDMDYLSLPAGGYRLTVYGDSITADCVDVQYDYNGVVPIAYAVVDQGEGFIQVEFNLEGYVETLRFTVTNRTKQDILFQGYRLNELK